MKYKASIYLQHVHPALYFYMTRNWSNVWEGKLLIQISTHLTVLITRYTISFQSVVLKLSPALTNLTLQKRHRFYIQKTSINSCPEDKFTYFHNKMIFVPFFLKCCWLPNQYLVFHTCTCSLH
jgi:hypothetical protein